ncbi:MAG: hypothetical protein H7836_15200 [Magnetococcus sp. YQC-3]
MRPKHCAAVARCVSLIGSQFYERTALSINKAAMLQKAEHADSNDLLTPAQAIKDPFVLELPRPG